MLTNLISPHSGEVYTMKQTLNKCFERSSLLGEIKNTCVFKCMYNSTDNVLEFKDVGPSASMWGDSVTPTINGKLPVHATAGGKIEAGFCSFAINQHESLNYDLSDSIDHLKHVDGQLELKDKKEKMGYFKISIQLDLDKVAETHDFYFPIDSDRWDGTLHETAEMLLNIAKELHFRSVFSK